MTHADCPPETGWTARLTYTTENQVVATLEVAVEASQLVLQFRSPAMNLLGFEAPTPSYAATRVRIEEQIKRYNRADLHQERQKEIMARYGVANATDLPIDLRAR